MVHTGGDAVLLHMMAGPSAQVRGEALADSPSTPLADFGPWLRQAVEHVDGVQHHADSTVAAFLRGDNVPVHRVMVELAQADMTVRVATVLTTKALAAYGEIARMQV